MTRDEARLLFSDYLEDALSMQQRDELQAFLANEPDSAAEIFVLERTLSLLHRLPPREPMLDMWRELSPKAEEFRATRRLGWSERLRIHGEMFRAQVSEGVILWTHLLAARVRMHLGHHLPHDHSLTLQPKKRGE